MDIAAALGGGKLQELWPRTIPPVECRFSLPVGSGQNTESIEWGLGTDLMEQDGPKIEAKPAAHEAVRDIAANPHDDDLQVALRVQIKKLLTEDSALKADLTRLLDAADEVGSVVNVSARGRESQAAGRDIITTGRDYLGSGSSRSGKNGRK